MKQKLMLGVVLAAVVIAAFSAISADGNTDHLKQARDAYFRNDLSASEEILKSISDESDSPLFRNDVLLLKAYLRYSAGEYAVANSILEKIDRSSLTTIQRVDFIEVRSLIAEYLKHGENPAFVAVWRDTAPVIDGNLSDWDTNAMLPPGKAFRGQAYLPQRNQLNDGERVGTWGAARLRNDEPFAEIYMSWDDRNLYIAGRVSDDDLTEEKPHRYIFADHVLLMIDGLNQKTLFYKPGILSFWISPAGKPRVGMANRAPGVAPVETVYDPKEIVFSVAVHDAQYHFEAAIPLKLIRADPASAPCIGFNYLVVDRVKSGEIRRRQAWKGIPSGPASIIYEIEQWPTVRLARTASSDSMPIAATPE